MKYFGCGLILKIKLNVKNPMCYWLPPLEDISSVMMYNSDRLQKNVIVYFETGQAVMGKFTLVRCLPVATILASFMVIYQDIQIILSTWKGRV